MPPPTALILVLFVRCWVGFDIVSTDQDVTCLPPTTAPILVLFVHCWVGFDIVSTDQDVTCLPPTTAPILVLVGFDIVSTDQDVTCLVILLIFSALDPQIRFGYAFCVKSADDSTNLGVVCSLLVIFISLSLVGFDIVSTDQDVTCLVILLIFSALDPQIRFGYAFCVCG
ncbi:hypothetical protein GQ457_04G013860 [Hibiscus cannabinus]